MAAGEQRHSSIELLRILAMLMIVAGHFLCQSGVAAAHGGFAVSLFSSGARWACNLFLLVGCWFMVDAPFRPQRIVRLYLTVLAYTLPLTVVAIVCGASPSTKDVLRGFLPFTGRALWFASAYISLMLLAPWLNRVLELPRRSFAKLLLVMTVLLPGVCTLPDPQTCYAIDVAWFVYVYLAVGFVKRHCALPDGKAWLAGCLLLGLGLYAGLVAVSCGTFMGFASSWAGQCLSDFKTLPNFLSAALVFCFFVKLDIGRIGWLNGLARPAFAVYLFHQTPAFFPFLWSRICRVGDWVDSPHWAACSLAVVVGVYAAVMMLDSVRRHLATAVVHVVDAPFRRLLV